jgi:transcriptional regulator with XRE-family HTH domain
MSRRTTPADQHISARLRELRRAAGLSQTDVAERLGITFQQVQKYENGSNRISAGRLFLVAKILRLPITDFYMGLS